MPIGPEHALEAARRGGSESDASVEMPDFSGALYQAPVPVAQEEVAEAREDVKESGILGIFNAVLAEGEESRA